MKLCEKHHHLLTGEGECLACKHAELLDYLEKLKANHKKELLALKARLLEVEGQNREITC